MLWVIAMLSIWAVRLVGIALIVFAGASILRELTRSGDDQ